MTNNNDNTNSPDKNFICELVKPDRILAHFDNTELVDLEIKDLVLETTALKNVGWATLFAYMHRRFGLPNVAGDDYKDLSAGWLLSTTNPKVYVKVSPSVGGPDSSFSIYFEQDSNNNENVNLAAFKLSDVQKDEIKKAYRSTLIDLLRPVCIRDAKINALGELGDSDFDSKLLNYDEETDTYDFEVHYHYSSGCPMPEGFFGNKEWKTFRNLLSHLGNGDISAGRNSLMNSLLNEAFEEANKQTDQVKRLMMMSSFENRAILKERLNFSESELELIEKEFRQLTKRDPVKKELLDRLNLNDLDIAVNLLSKAGLKDGGLEKGVKNFLDEHQRSTSRFKI